MKTFSRLRAGVAPVVVGFVLFSSMPALAQQTATDRDEAATELPPTAAAETEAAIVVTGSRIRLPGFASTEPIVTVTSEYVEDRNLTNIADALNEIPGYRGSVTPDGAQGSFGQGVNFINAFGLGSNRSLTLINGRRVVSSNVATIFGNAAPGTQVDLNIIPTILVDRVDRVAIGGAPVYGSDAIASTVNVILKKRYTGLDLRATSGITEEGDNFRINVSAAGGIELFGGRGNLTAAVQYEKVNGVLANARDFLRASPGFATNPCTVVTAGTCTTANLVSTIRGPAGATIGLNDGRVNTGIGFNNSQTDGFPGSVLTIRNGIPSLSVNGVIANIGALRPLDFNVQFARTGELVPFNRGTLFGGPITSGASRSSAGDGFIFADFNQITSDVRRISANLFFNYDVTDNIRFFAEGTFFNGRGNELVQQQSFNSTLFGGGSGALTFSVDNPFLTAQARNLLVANGYQTFRLSRVNLDLNDGTGSSDNDLYRGVIGFEGAFKIGDRDFNFEVSGNYGRNNFTDFGQDINQQNFVNAVNVTTVNGQIVCTATPAVLATPGFTPIADPNCRPLNLFGRGAPSAEALAYVIQDNVAESVLQQTVINANVGGSPFDLFNNPIAFNIGYEHRVEEATFTPSAFQQAGRGRSVAIAPNGGKYTLNEVFGELLVPFITPNNDFFIHSLEGFARGRYVDNTVNGGFFAWSAGGSISPIQDITFRGNFTRSFRAPSITELFSPVTNTFVTVPDLCSTGNINAGPVPVTRARNCNAFLDRFPDATPLAAAVATVPGRNGGNPNLGNEEADSYTFGVVLQPRFIRGLSIAVDYLDVKINNPIASLTVAQIASGCFDNEAFDASDPANGNNFCSFIRRDANGQVPADPANPAVTAGFVNGQRISFSGIQGVVDYQTSLEGIGIPGQLGLGGDVFYVRRRINDITGVAPSRTDGTNATGTNDPEWQGQFRFRYTNNGFGFITNVNYTGELLTSRFNRGPSPNDTREFDQYKDFVTVDASVFVTTPDDFRLTLSVTNLTNRVGQEYFGVIIPASINDRFGRRFAVSVQKQF
ncbi:TonB-dependent receptor [Blastomonas sp. AAP53]|uniref:TonB-dependent receptor domain-containing protein n=1 Tax=Blastomonas sp. AAP53 TaxID=1248760 RepID=UPI0002F23B75|nr:TonB-dependent receptor [Blastomonas sp. AAP53]